VIVYAFGLAFLLATTSPSSAATPYGGMFGFFPLRPPCVALYQASGVLTQYGVGMKSGGVEIQIGDQRTYFYVSEVLRINGSRIRCAWPRVCSNWPSSLVVGKTKVTVTYWATTRYGKPVFVTDQIDYKK